MASMTHATDVQTGKFNKRRYGLLPAQQRKLIAAANADGDVNFGWDRDVEDEEIVESDAEAATHEGENGIDWI